ncbi:NUDIX hydrolase [Bacillus sp. FSL K6-3431]|uniref:NUDIX hydrolase n=1 Tax=Bacillus sp. FSL K6-3431 TaxID=2921500 RepID=UPI0030F846CE
MSTPKHIVAVSAYVTNRKNEVLLVKTHWRSDTWELPGGQVEEGESLDEAVRREFLEETGIIIKPIGVTGVYSNTTKGIVSIVFYAEYVSGEIKIQPEEIKEACFVELNESNIDTYLVRPHMKSRTLDAMRKQSLSPYEAWEVDPFNLLERLE